MDHTTAKFLAGCAVLLLAAGPVWLGGGGHCSRFQLLVVFVGELRLQVTEQELLVVLPTLQAQCGGTIPVELGASLPVGGLRFRWERTHPVQLAEHDVTDETVQLGDSGLLASGPEPRIRNHVRRSARVAIDNDHHGSLAGKNWAHYYRSTTPTTWNLEPGIDPDPDCGLQPPGSVCAAQLRQTRTRTKTTTKRCGNCFLEFVVDPSSAQSPAGGGSMGLGGLIVE
ncbi:hypothetical protein pipiens_004287 [Culex pipiens pipiens]|uniref:Uncharacterized protein n=1 Tax=Culex pipiens pipiens TaxID=38569 RepID=A0ABD1CKC8_CULPP